MSNAKSSHHILQFYFIIISDIICSLVSISLHRTEGFELNVLVHLVLMPLFPSFSPSPLVALFPPLCIKRDGLMHAFRRQGSEQPDLIEDVPSLQGVGLGDL